MTSESATDTSKIRTALTRYRIMAWATGIWLILLCVEIVLKHIVKVDWPIWWIPPAHGAVYFIYLLATLDLAVKARWAPWTALATMLAGTIPLLGIILEHFRTKQVKAQFNLEANATPEAVEPAPGPDATSSPSAQE